MATNWDKNSNGIPDSIERPGTGLPKLPTKPAPVTRPLPAYATGGGYGAPAPTIPNYATGNAPAQPWLSPMLKPASTAPTFDPNKAIDTSWVPKNLLSKPGQQEQQAQDTPLPDFQSALMQALDLIKSLGIGGGGGLQALNYDPMREEARGRASEYDARLKAMYDQLAGSIRSDAGGISENFQGAIDQSGQRSVGTQQSIQGASDAAQQRNLQQLEALGIGEAAGGIVAQGRDLNTDTSRALQDVAQRGQITGDQLGINQQAALSHNTNLAGVAGLEGNTQRARVGSELSQLLAQYDMAEQESRQQAAAANAQSGQNSLSQAMGLANSLFGGEWQSRQYQDEMARAIYEMQNQQGPQSILNPESLSLLQQLLEGSGASAPEDALDYAQLLKLINPR